MESVEEIIRLREEAIQKLLGEKAELEARLDTLTARLDEIDDKLRRLGYKAEAEAPSQDLPASEVRKSRSTSTAEQPEYTTEQHLRGKSALITHLFSKLSHEIRALGEDVQELPRKNYIAYRTDRNLCGVIVQASKLWVYIDIDYSELRDPKDIAEDCSGIGHWATGDTRFTVKPQDEIEYAMALIRQAYEVSRQ